MINMKTKAFILLILFLAFTVYLNNYYRPYVYKNKIEDYGLADVGYNLIAVINISLIAWLGEFKITRNKIIDILIITVGYLVHEFLSYFFPFLLGVFDLKDCVALFISGLISLVILFILNRKEFNEHKNEIFYFHNK